MTQQLLPKLTDWHPVILLVAGPVTRDTDTETWAARDEAILSLVEAIFAAGGRVAFPADPDLALLVASANLAYSDVLTAEPTPEPRPAAVDIYETDREDRGLRRMLAPLRRWNAVGYHDVRGNLIRLDEYDPFSDEEPMPQSKAQPVTPRFLNLVEPFGAVIVAPSRDLVEEVDLISSRVGRYAVLPGTGGIDLAGRYPERDSFRRIKDRLTDEPHAPAPWPSLLQELVQSWLER